MAAADELNIVGCETMKYVTKYQMLHISHQCTKTLNTAQWPKRQALSDYIGDKYCLNKWLVYVSQ